MSRTVQVMVTGRVQGVGYRAWTAETARDLGLAGHVRNRSDGAVEALLRGPQDAVETMLARMRRGPALARVEDLAVADGDGPASADFAVLPTV